MSSRGDDLASSLPHSCRPLSSSSRLTHLLSLQTLTRARLPAPRRCLLCCWELGPGWLPQGSWRASSSACSCSQRPRPPCCSGSRAASTAGRRGPRQPPRSPATRSSPAWFPRWRDAFSVHCLLCADACFRTARLGAAIDCYTEAIALCPRVSVYWVNRGLCHFHRKDWARFEEDSRRALALDNASVKGH